MIDNDLLLDMKCVTDDAKCLNGPQTKIKNSGGKNDRKKITFIALFESGRIDCLQTIGCYHLSSQKTLNIFESVHEEEISNETIPKSETHKICKLSKNAQIIDIQILERNAHAPPSTLNVSTPVSASNCKQIVGYHI